MTRLDRAARSLLDRAVTAYGGDPEARAVLTDARRRLDEPLRVALAGTLKAGKSTLLNALIGEQVAPTDAGECTRLVTWYRGAPVAAVHAHAPDGREVPLPVVRGPKGLEVDPGQDAGVERLVVDWPSRHLQDVTLIDTPGLDSLNPEYSGRSTSFVTPDDRPSGADVVVYLMRHAHRTDVDFLEAFRDLAAGGAGGLGGVGPSGTVVVLARADEVGSGRIDALMAAQRVARTYRADSPLRPLCQTVVPVAGLLAETARTLRRSEFDALAALARAPRAAVDDLLLSADRFVGAPLPAEVTAGPDGARLDADTRRALLDRLGVFGVRLATTLLRQGAADAASLADELARRSGLEDLRDVLRARFTTRREVHQARSALLALDMVLRRRPHPAARGLAVELESVLAGAHEFTEQRVLTALRTGAVAVPEDVAPEAERLLGGDGPDPRSRLGLPAGVPDSEVRRAAREALERWRERAESPLSTRGAADVCRAVVRSVEGSLTA
jgi:hypothetical protein